MASNPFGDSNAFSGGGGAANPFADPSVTGASGSYEPPAMDTAPLLSKGSAPPPQSVAASLSQREKDLAAREAALREREATAAAAQADALKYGIKKKNWPRCCPILHHDIAGEIPENSRFNVRVAYILFFVTVVALWWNWFTILVLWVTKKPQTVTDFRSYSQFLWSLIVAFFGTFGAWYGWYRGLYFGLSRNASCRFLCFFVMFFAHTCFAICAAVGVPATAGCIVLIDISANWTYPGESYGFQIFLTAVSFVLWTLIAIVSAFFLKRFHTQYKNKGQQSFQDVRGNAANAAVSGAAQVAQTDAFKEAAAGAARTAVQQSFAAPQNQAPTVPGGGNPFGV